MIQVGVENVRRHWSHRVCLPGSAARASGCGGGTHDPRTKAETTSSRVRDTRNRRARNDPPGSTVTIDRSSHNPCWLRGRSPSSVTPVSHDEERVPRLGEADTEISVAAPIRVRYTVPQLEAAGSGSPELDVIATVPSGKLPNYLNFPIKREPRQATRTLQHQLLQPLGFFAPCHHSPEVAAP